jgi:hypothetical protein
MPVQTPAPTPAPQVPAPPALPVIAPDVDLPVLQSQAAELQVQLAGLRAQHDGLKNQLDDMLRSNPARPGVVQQWADAGVQIANMEGKLAILQARIAQKQGRPVGTPQIPVGPRFNFGPPNVAGPVMAVVALVLLLPISVAWAKRMGRRIDRPAARAPSDLSMRLERMEHAIDTIAIEVERVSEGQRFVTKLMADRATASVPSDRSSADTSAPQAKQPLALGAGPIEPIVVGQRDQVRQRVVTPH